MKRSNYLLFYSTALFAMLGLRPSATADVIVNLDATIEAVGPLPEWVNTGTLGDEFAARGMPEVKAIAGVNAVTLAGGADHYVGPVAPSVLAGINPSRTIEAWVFNPSIAPEETIIAWGRRDGPDGSNLAFNYGNNGAYGAVGHWGGADMGWNNAGGAPAAGIWHYLVYTYDGGGVAAAGTTRVYADGVLQNSEFLGTISTHDGLGFVIGGQNDGAGAAFGLNSGLSIAKIRVHDVVLSNAQISAQFAAEQTQFFPAAYLSGSRVLSSSKFAFTINDTQTPSSVTAPSTFSVTVEGVAAGWTAAGGEGIVNGSITSPSIMVSSAGTVELAFAHRYNFEDGGTAWDGGVVQYSVNNGAFQILDDANFSQNGYFPSALIGNGILLGERAFNGVSAGFTEGERITSIATIPGVSSGDTLQVRFLAAWDDAVTPDGIDWEIGSVAVTAGATTLFDEDFSAGDGGFTSESTGAGADWNFAPASQPELGTLVATKEGDVLTLCVPIDWINGRDYNFTITGEDTLGGALVYQTTVTTPTPPYGAPRTWPVTIPGPLGTVGAWGVRTYLNEGINAAEDLTAVLDFLATASTRTPVLTPDTVIDTQESNLNFVDPESNDPATLWGVIPCSRPFPGNALSTATNGGTPRGDDHVVTSAHGTIQITEESDYTFNVRGDDGFMFRIEATNGGSHPVFIAAAGAGVIDQVAQNILYFPTGTGDADTRGVAHLTPGIYNIDYVTWEGGGGFWYQVSAAKGFFLNSADTDTWGAIGYSTSRTEPIPYPSMLGDWTVLSTPPGSTVGTLSDSATAIDAALAADAVASTSMWSQINFNDPGFGGTGRIAGDSPWPRDTAGVDDDNYAMRMSGTLHIPEAGDYLLGYQGDDGSNLTVVDASVWRAYNDSAFKAGQVNAANVSTIGLGRNFEGQGSSGVLSSVGSGMATTVTATYTEFFTTGSVNSAGDAATYAVGSDAEQLFANYVDIAGNMSYGDSPGWYVDLTLTGLDPTKAYMFAATVNRAGGPTYANRVTNWTLMGADSARYASSAGAQKVSETSVEFSTGDNTLGLVARWREIRAGADGTIVIRSTHGVGAGGGGIAGADAFRGYAGGAFLLSEQSGFSALTENATGGGSIGRADTIAANAGSLGSAVDFSPFTSALFEQPGALAGSADTAISTTATDAQRMNVPFTPALNPLGAFSSEIWVKPGAIPGGLTCVLSSGNFADPRSGWLVYMNPGVGWNFRGYTGVGLGTAFDITGGGAPVEDQWYHLVVTWNGTDAKIYVNGVLDAGAQVGGVTTYANATTPISSGRLQVGSRSDNAFGWSGSADELAVYGSELDAATILSHYQNGGNSGRAQPYETLVLASNPLGYWRFNEPVKPLVDLNTITTDVSTGNSSTVGRIFLAAGDYPISSTYREGGGGSYYEIFAARDVAGGCVPTQVLRNGGWPSIQDNSGLQLVPNPGFGPPTVVGNLTINPDFTMSFTFASRIGESYSLFTSTDLASWEELDDGILASGVLTTVDSDSVPALIYNPIDPRRYYKIELNP